MSQVAVPPPGETVSPPAPPRRSRGGRNLVRDILEVLALAFALYIVIAFALQTVRVDGESMEPTLQDRDLLFADKLSYHLHAPDRGDIIVLQPPDDPTRDFIKRIIGVPGDAIEIDGRYPGKNGPVTVVLVKPNNQGAPQRLVEPYLPDQTKNPWNQMNFCCDRNGLATAEPQWLVIPKDEYFVMGDNRNASHDSRAIGLIPRNNILARAWIRIWPLNHFGFLGSGPTLTAATTATIVPFPAALLRRRRRRAQRALRDIRAA